MFQEPGMLDRLADFAHGFTAEVSAPIATAILSAILAAAGTVTWVAGELWTEEKVRAGVGEHEARIEPRLERIEQRSEAVMRRQAEFRRDIDVIVEKLDGADQRAARTERMVEQLLRRQLDEGSSR